MAKKEFGLVAVGNALVDVLALTDEASFGKLAQQFNMQRGAMNGISAERGNQLHAAMGRATEMPGGSAANSLFGFASFGGKGAFMGKVAGDRFGLVFAGDMCVQDIHFKTPFHSGTLETGRSYILVTPDKERTMNTYIGASATLSPADMDEELIAKSRIMLLEGYLFDRPTTKKAFMKAALAARSAGTKVAFTLSDHNCVLSHHADFRALAANHTDILIGNEKEFIRLTSSRDFEMAARRGQKLCDTLAMTRGAQGVLIIDRGQRYDIPAEPAQVVDTTGAGDAFAAGFLFGISEGMTPEEAGKLGAKAASRTIGHVGARLPGAKNSDLLL